MFTGLIEETGEVAQIVRGRDSARLTIAASRVLEATNAGDSIAVNGVCLTVVEMNAARGGASFGLHGEIAERDARGAGSAKRMRGTFSADVMHETLRRSSLGNLRAGSIVNLERAMPAGGRFGGHIVSGHIDGTGEISCITQDDIAYVYTIKVPRNLMRYVVEKGSVAIDGISLTVAGVAAETFSVSIIPHSQANTNLRELHVGSVVNVECDVVGKYVDKILGAGLLGASAAADAASVFAGGAGLDAEGSLSSLGSGKITEELLRECGF